MLLATPALTLVEQEFAFAVTDFERVRSLIHQRAGIDLQPGKQAMVYSRLSRRLRKTGHRGFGAYNLCQDEASCVVLGMPREAIAMGATNEVLPLTGIATHLLERLRSTAGVTINRV